MRRIEKTLLFQPRISRWPRSLTEEQRVEHDRYRCPVALLELADVEDLLEGPPQRVEEARIDLARDSRDVLVLGREKTPEHGRHSEQGHDDDQHDQQKELRKALPGEDAIESVA
jgi:hypothetical protein